MKLRNAMLVATICATAGANADVYMCRPCAGGTYSAADSQSCTPCAAGTYSVGTGNTGCTICPANTYSSMGATGCTGCPADSTTLGQIGRTSSNDCKCSAGYYKDGAGNCTACPVGYRCPDGIAIKCPAGQYQNEVGKSTCKTCPAGQYQDAIGQASCKSCSNLAARPDRTRCSQPINEYSGWCKIASGQGADCYCARRNEDGVLSVGIYIRNYYNNLDSENWCGRDCGNNCPGVKTYTWN
jgi:hypothetical protein